MSFTPLFGRQSTIDGLNVPKMVVVSMAPIDSDSTQEQCRAVINIVQWLAQVGVEQFVVLSNSPSSVVSSSANSGNSPASQWRMFQKNVASENFSTLATASNPSVANGIAACARAIRPWIRLLLTNTMATQPSLHSAEVQSGLPRIILLSHTWRVPAAPGWLASSVPTVLFNYDHGVIAYTDSPEAMIAELKELYGTVSTPQPGLSRVAQRLVFETAVQLTVNQVCRGTMALNTFFSARDFLDEATLRAMTATNVRARWRPVPRSSRCDASDALAVAINTENIEAAPTVAEEPNLDSTFTTV